MTLRYEDRQRLYNDGFTAYEISHYAKARAPDGTRQPPMDIDSPLWQAVRAKRIVRATRIAQDYQKTHGKEISRRYLSRLLNQWYVRHPKADPFDWLKREYRRLKKVTGKKVKKATRRLQGFPGARQYVRRK